MPRCGWVVLVVVLLARAASAVVIGNFDGLQRLIDRADAIVVLRIDEHIDVRRTPSLSTVHRCYIYQVLKGAIRAGSTIPVRLLDTRGGLVTPFALGSAHLVFLHKGDAGQYGTLGFQGANLQVSPLGNEQPPPGKTVKEQIRNLLQRSMQYFQDVRRKEEQFLRRVLGS